MVHPFAINLPTRVVFGAGELSRLGEYLQGIGSRALLVTGRSWARKSGTTERAIAAIKAAGIGVVLHEGIPADPDGASMVAGAELLRHYRCDLVVALGGGSVIDAAKVMAALATSGGSPLDLVAHGCIAAPLPMVAVPTTAGTGSEVTRYAVISDPESCRKVTAKDDRLCPRLAVLDPELTADLPRQQTALTGFDAFLHSLEAYLCRTRHPLVTALAPHAMGLVLRHLPRLLARGEHAEQVDEDRAALMLAALYGGICITLGRTGVIHTMANHLGAHRHLPHGAALAAVLPPAMRFNAPAASPHLDAVAPHLGLANGGAVLEAILALPRQLAVAPAIVPLDNRTIDNLVARVASDKGLFSINPAPLTLEDVAGLYREIGKRDD